jgi:hypothetical protein
VALDQSARLEVLDALKVADVDDPIRQAAQTIYQALIEAELTQVIGAAPHQRSPDRLAQRNGHRPRVLGHHGRRPGAAHPQAAGRVVLPQSAGAAPAAAAAGSSGRLCLDPSPRTWSDRPVADPGSAGPPTGCPHRPCPPPPSSGCRRGAHSAPGRGEPSLPSRAPQGQPATYAPMAKDRRRDRPGRAAVKDCDTEPPLPVGMQDQPPLAVHQISRRIRPLLGSGFRGGSMLQEAAHDRGRCWRW